MKRGPRYEAVIYGGSFDPFHSGHVAVIRELIERYRTVVIAPTIQNPDKPRRATPIALRYEMIRRVLAAEGIELVQEPTGFGVYLESHPYCYTPELVRYWREVNRIEVDCAIGADLIDEVPSWNKGWVVKNVPLYVVAVIPDYPRSTDIRLGRATPHSAITDFIKEHGLYLETEDFATLVRAKAEAVFREMVANEDQFPGGSDSSVLKGGQVHAAGRNETGTNDTSSRVRWII